MWSPERRAESACHSTALEQPSRCGASPIALLTGAILLQRPRLINQKSAKSAHRKSGVLTQGKESGQLLVSEEKREGLFSLPLRL
jgi:hypothetical protein